MKYTGKGPRMGWMTTVKFEDGETWQQDTAPGFYATARAAEKSLLSSKMAELFTDAHGKITSAETVEFEKFLESSAPPGKEGLLTSLLDSLEGPGGTE